MTVVAPPGHEPYGMTLVMTAVGVGAGGIDADLVRPGCLEAGGVENTTILVGKVEFCSPHVR